MPVIKTNLDVWLFGYQTKTQIEENAAQRGNRLPARSTATRDIEPELLRRLPRAVRVKSVVRWALYGLGHVIVGAALFRHWFTSALNEGRQLIGGVAAEDIVLGLNVTLAFCVAAGLVLAYKIAQQFDWLACGKPVMGTVVEGYESGRGQRGEKLLLAYRYATTSGDDCTKYITVGPRTYDNTRIGDQATLLCHPQDEHSARLYSDFDVVEIV